ncbi:alpha-(1,3)-fucosyltransferase 11 [Parasteatoda tepidariorum]|uniref:alpha-(1,3)-fucosyltransferase 11 n=1 Tax=Parasteatoda tepidariorum TaxID=114398 RepID=UPI001C7243BF|nr:alpha-(1,3)-fucosyltransferase 11 [Parasteatoda tepidariorum]
MFVSFYLRFLVFCIIFDLISISFAKKFNPKDLPVVIWWSDLLYPYEAKEKEIHCSKSNKCVSSFKRTYNNDEIPVAYLFYGTDFKGDNLPLPRKSNHLWALLHEESPLNNFLFSHSSGIKLFNFTATFSRHSDFPLTTQHLPSLDYLMRKPVPLEIKNEYRKNGTAPVLYLQSHCNVPSDRDRYVKQLMEFIDVDSYGECLHNKDLPTHLLSTDTHNDESLFHFISKYKFHLAFENAICEDYITEKFFRALHVGSVPIYRGSRSIEDWLPSPVSAIIVDNFKDPQDLAMHISRLDENDILYEECLNFKKDIKNIFLKQTMEKRTWGVNDPNELDFLRGYECHLCNKLWSDDLQKNSVANKSHMNCPQPHTSLDIDIKKSIKTDQWLLEEWAETYWFALDQAKAIEQMIQNNENDTSKFWNYISMNKYN